MKKVITLIIAALSAVALAAAGRAGMLDFLSRYQGTYIPENAGDFIESDVATLEEGVLTVTAANVAADKAEKVVLDVANFDAKNVSVRILTGEMHDMNTFEDKEKVKIADFTDFECTEEGIVLNLPACSVAEVTIRG